MKKTIAILLAMCLICLVGCTKINDNYSSNYTSTFSEIDTSSQIISSAETVSVNSDNVSSSDKATQVEDNKSNNTITSEVTSSNITSSDTTVTAPRPEKVTKIYDFNINTTVSEPQKLVFNDPQNGNKLPYCLYLPDDYSSSKKYPVILFLHGAGEIGSDNQLQLNNIRNMFAYNAHYVSQSILICPQTPEWWNLDRDYYGDKKGTLSSAINLLKDIQNKYSCDSNRIYLTGLSMGAFATWDVLENYGDMFAAAVPVCGGGNEMMAERYVDIPIVMYHGTADLEILVSTEGKSKLEAAYTSSGGKEFTVYCLSQKIYSFTATTAPIDNKILIADVFSADNYRGFYEILKSICF